MLATHECFLDAETPFQHILIQSTHIAAMDPDLTHLDINQFLIAVKWLGSGPNVVGVGGEASCWVLREKDGGEGEAHGDGDGDKHGDEPMVGGGFAMTVEGTPDGMGGSEARRLCGTTQWVEEIP